MSNKSRHRRLLFMMGLVLFSLLGSIWISSNSGMTVYADSKTNTTQNSPGSGTVINQQEEPQISTVNSNTTDNTSSSDDQTSQNQVTNTEEQPRAPTKQNDMGDNSISTSNSAVGNRLGSVSNTSNSVGQDVSSNITQNSPGSGTVINQQEEPQISTVNSNTTDNTSSSDDQTSQNQVTNTEEQPRAPTKQNDMGDNSISTFNSAVGNRLGSVSNTSNSVGETGISENWEDQFITKVELQDENGNPKTNFGIYDNMQAAWNFVIPANKAKSGDTMTVAIPSVLTLATMTKFDITDAGGTAIFHAVANPNTGKVTITLTDAVKNNHNAITGGFKLWVHWNTNKVKQDTTVPVNWSNSGSTDIHINPSNGPDPNEVLYKWGGYDTNNPNIIHWRVRINYANKTIDNTTYTDLVGGNQKLVSGSVSAYKVKFQSDGEGFNILSVYPDSATIENGTSGFKTTLGDISGPVIIDYETNITNNGASSHYENSGSLTGDNIEKQTVDVYSPFNGGEGNADTTTTISGTKTWNDNNNQDGIRPSSITVNLLANGQQVASKKVSASDNWQYSFDNLAAYANGQKITYTVTEDAVAGYTSTIDGYNVTNNHTPATVKVSGTKTWNDNNNQDGIRPSSITVNLLANGQQVASKKVSASDNWQYSFDNLAAYANGQKITYTVTEDAVAGYTSTIDGYNVTNNHTPATVKVSGTKTWNDNNNQDGIRPSSITVNLLANGQQVASKKVSASDNWQYSFDNLAAYANGQKITYTVTEDAVAGYTSTIDGYNVTNNHTPATVKVSGTKTWNDNNNQDGIRPSSITVNLLANGQQVASKKVSASDNWQYSFDNLAAYANGQKITYTVTEDAVAGYTSTIDGYNVTNNHTPATVKVSGTKTWNDNNNQDGIRPSSITVNLLANGQQVASKKVSASDNWQYSFDNLAAYANGQKITYTVTEDAVAGYTSTIDGYNVTNNHTPATVKVSGTKTWNDNNNQDGIRPSSITVNLLANGQQVASKKVSASDNWQYSFDNLAAYANGQKITYTVTEDAVAGYTSTIDGYNVTNNHTPATVKVSGTKTWNDNNNQDGIRPSSITVNLLANGQQVASKKVSASDNWQYSFDNLAAYANGQKITYTVTEDAVAGYTSTIDGYNVTNNHTPATVKVSGTKTWNDNNNQDGIRPSSITVNLLANGQQVASKKVSASDNWQYSFDNLAAYANGQKITYTVTEDAVAGYTSTIDGYNVTNNHTPATVKVSGTKTWNDNNNQDGIRPSSITVNLLANGQQVASKKVSASDNWQYSFDNLAAYANGQKITYTVTEDAVAGYTSTIDGYNVTNNHTPATVKVSGTKTWNDNNNQDGIRPSSITVNLLANGQQVASKKVSASDNWQYSFDNLAAYANGQKITYTVTEDAVAGYTSTIDGYNVTNNHTPATVKVSGTKTWNDNNNQDGIRPSSITVNLLANGQQVASKKVSASDNWQYSFDNLAAYANGQKITYTVTEDAVAGYTSTIDGYNITNTHNPTTPKKPQVPNNPTTPKKPQVPNNGNKVVPKDFTQGKTYDKTSRLPQTGDRSSIGMMFVGLVMLLLSLGLVVINRFTI